MKRDDDLMSRKQDEFKIKCPKVSCTHGTLAANHFTPATSCNRQTDLFHPDTIFLGKRVKICGQSIWTLILGRKTFTLFEDDDRSKQQKKKNSIMVFSSVIYHIEVKSKIKKNPIVVFVNICCEREKIDGNDYSNVTAVTSSSHFWQFSDSFLHSQLLQENIGQFGGDPESVTLMGHSENSPKTI